jgi:hypothetical protein
MIENMTDRLALAYGLLWNMKIDRSDPSLLLASEARRAVGGLLTMEQKAEGIDAARRRMKVMRVDPPLIDKEVLEALWEGRQ